MHFVRIRHLISKRVTAGVLLLIVVIVAVLELTGATHIFHRAKPPVVVSGSSFNTKGEPSANKSKTTSSQNNGNSSTTDQKSSISNAQKTLIMPSGSFVSNHHPNLSGSPAPNSMTSVCNTMPGASCKITFTNGSTTAELPSHTVDANGSAYWTWKLQDIHLTVGSWKIQAIASLNGQSKSASDAMDLVVSQ